MIGYPLVSILVPCYNVESYLRECLESILAQTYPNLEIIAYDARSTDKTWEILQEFYPKVKSFRSPCMQNIPQACNFLLSKSQGDYIHYQAADDLMHSRFFIELMLPWLLTGEYEAVLCNADFFLENDPGNLQGGWYVRPRFPGEDWLAYIIQVGGNADNSLFKREALIAVGGFRETLRCAEDYDLHIRLAEKGFHFATVGQSLIRERTKKEHSYGTADDLLVMAYKVVVDSWKRLEISPKEVSDEVRTVFAQRLWEIGRLLTQIGEHRYAVEAIRLSKKIGKPRQIPGSFLYRALIKILGIPLVERIRFYWYKIRNWFMRNNVKR